MRELADADRIHGFMRALGREAEGDGACYLTGGATAVLHGWRNSTIDVDIKLVPEADVLLRAIQRLKEELQINVELASPLDTLQKPGKELPPLGNPPRTHVPYCSADARGRVWGAPRRASPASFSALLGRHGRVVADRAEIRGVCL